MYSIENAMYSQLCKLRDEYGLQGIKAEFEAEGSSFRDLMRLRRLTYKAGVKLYVKIGGVEAIRDIKDSLEIGVDGIIAPMVESAFGAKKFHDSIERIYGDHYVHTTLNIETKLALDNIDDILNYANEKFDNVTIGRSDLASSYFDPSITPDSDFIFTEIEKVGTKVLSSKLTFTVGGSISSRTIEKINTEYQDICNKIEKLETRKVMLPTKNFLNSSESITEALKFEELYILSKKEFSDMHISSEITRLTEINRRK